MSEAASLWGDVIRSTLSTTLAIAALAGVGALHEWGLTRAGARPVAEAREAAGESSASSQPSPLAASADALPVAGGEGGVSDARAAGPLASAPPSIVDGGAGAAARGPRAERAGPARGATGPAGAAAASARPTPTGPEVLPDGRIVLNTASVATLQRLPGVGAKRAEAIVAARARAGGFRRTSDLLRVKGIGPKTLAAWGELLVLDPPTAPAPSASP